MLGRRLQVLIDEERHRALDREAKRHGTSIGAIVRDAIDERLAPGSGDRSGAGARLLAAPPAAATEPDELREEIDRLSDR